MLEYTIHWLSGDVFTSVIVHCPPRASMVWTTLSEVASSSSSGSLRAVRRGTSVVSYTCISRITYMDTHIARARVEERRVLRVLPAVAWRRVSRDNHTL